MEEVPGGFCTSWPPGDTQQLDIWESTEHGELPAAPTRNPASYCSSGEFQTLQRRDSEVPRHDRDRSERSVNIVSGWDHSRALWAS